MARTLSVDDLSAEQRKLLATLTNGVRANFLDAAQGTAGTWALPGPFGPMLLAPNIGDPLQFLGAAIRYSGRLPDDVRELAIVAAASACRSVYELEHHLPLARAAGISDDLLEAARLGAKSADPLFDAVVSTSWSLTVDGAAKRGALDVLESRLGDAAVFELVVLVGYYRTLAMVMSVFGIE